MEAQAVNIDSMSFVRVRILLTDVLDQLHCKLGSEDKRTKRLKDDKKEVKHEVFDVESSASEKEDKFKDEKLYNLDKILSKKIKNSSGKEIVIIKKHYDAKVGLNVFYCQICEKSVDGETNLKTHIFGVRHLRNEVVWPTLDKTKSQSSRRSEGMNFLILLIQFLGQKTI